jgi:hypothetical protein
MTDTESAIVQEILHPKITLSHIVDRLRLQGYKESDVRSSAWALIDRRIIKLTQEWTLEMDGS